MWKILPLVPARVLVQDQVRVPAALRARVRAARAQQALERAAHRPQPPPG